MLQKAARPKKCTLFLRTKKEHLSFSFLHINLHHLAQNLNCKKLKFMSALYIKGGEAGIRIKNFLLSVCISKYTQYYKIK